MSYIPSTTTADLHVPPSTDEKYHSEEFGVINAKSLVLTHHVAPPREGFKGAAVTNTHHELKYFEEGEMIIPASGAQRPGGDIPRIYYQIVNNAATVIVPFFAFDDNFIGGLGVASDTTPNQSTFMVVPPRLRPLSPVFIRSHGRYKDGLVHSNTWDLLMTINTNGRITFSHGINHAAIGPALGGTDNHFSGGSVTYVVPNFLR